MDFLLICTVLGLALAAGVMIGAVVPPVMPAWGAIVGAAPLGAIAGAGILSSEDEPVAVGVLVGLLGAALGALVTRDIVAGAARRQSDSLEARETAAGVTGLVVIAAVALAALSLFVPPVSLVAAAALILLWLSRRRREQRKHEGLRVLR